MLTGCFVHTIDSILPPGETFVHDYGRLEYYAATKLLENMEYAETHLPKSPIRIFQTLFQTLICKHFYTNSDMCEPNEDSETLRKSLLLLLKYWPGESFILRNLIPTLAPIGDKLKIWTSVNESNDYRTALQHSIDCLMKYYMYIVGMLFDIFLEISKCILSTNNQMILRRCDISGYYGHLDKGFNPSTLLGNMKNFSSNLPVCNGKIELVCDAVCDYKTDLVALTTIAAMNKNAATGIIVHFRKIAFNLNPQNICGICGVLNHLGIEYCELNTNDKNGIISSSVITSLPNLKGFSNIVSSTTSIFQLNLLSSLNNLCQIDLSRINLKGQLEPLCKLPSGLIYLKLAGCGLLDEDVLGLTNSHHSMTLRHVDISENNVTLKPHLMYFCQNLENVEILALQGCIIDGEHLLEFSNLLCGLCALKLIDFKNNNFSSDIISCLSLDLCKSKSIKCVVFSVPEDLYIGNDALLVNTLRILKISLGRRKEDLMKQYLREFAVPQAFYTTQVQDRLKAFYKKIIKEVTDLNKNIHVTLEP
ncbi:unnamed protein product [Meganyctiphanes norvegica]|uniref:Uncharacterized protein n=2 Tax=Meganyctiphanes norvegica TaxID=48144 RepID=A0AAV2QQI7_MEGNR